MRFPRSVAVLAAVVLALVLGGCQVVFIPLPIAVAPAAATPVEGPVEGRAVPATPTPAAAVTVAPAGANDPEVLAQFDAMDAACSSDLTNAQQERGLTGIRPFFAGRQVQLVGTVQDVRDFGGTFDVIVTLDGADRDVRMDNLLEEQALALRKGQRVTLVGEVDVLGCWAYVTVVGALRTE